MKKKGLTRRFFLNHWISWDWYWQRNLQKDYWTMLCFKFVAVDYLGVSLNGGTPISHPKCWSFLVGKPHGFVGETHHFRSCPHFNCSKNCAATQLQVASASLVGGFCTACGSSYPFGVPKKCHTNRHKKAIWKSWYSDTWHSKATSM